jgi:hypothetical protein
LKDLLLAGWKVGKQKATCSSLVWLHLCMQQLQPVHESEK